MPWCKFLQVRLVKGTCGNCDGLLVVDRADGAAASAAERSAGVRRRAPSRRLAAGTDPLNALRGELHPRECERARMLAATLARTRMGPPRLAGYPKSDVAADAAAFVVLGFH